MPPDASKLEHEYWLIPAGRLKEMKSHFPGATMDRLALKSLAVVLEDSTKGLTPSLSSYPLIAEELKYMQIHLGLARHILDRVEGIVLELQEIWKRRQESLEIEM